jgi:predicted permease
LQSVPPGFDPHHVLTMQLTLPKVQYPDTLRQNEFVRQSLQRIETLPGVKAAAATINLPLIGTWGMGYRIEGQPNPSQQIADNANISPNYFRTMAIPVLQGRDFSEQDTNSSSQVIIISEAFARKHFLNENPLGQQILAGGVKRQIIGVVGDVRPRGLELEIKPQIYLPYAQKPTPSPFLTFTIRTEQEPLALAGAVEKEIRNLDKDLPLANIRTMEQIVSESLAQRRLTMLLLGIFAVTAVVLAAIGIYGVLSYSVTRQTHELGIRMALGAQQHDVLAMIMRQGMKQALLGVVLGLFGAVWLTNILKSLLFDVRTTDPLTFVLVALLLVIVALMACYIPARRATRVNPLQALRHE